MCGKVYGTSFETPEIIKLLGINVSKTLEWNTHVDTVAKRAGQHLGILLKAKRLLNTEGLATLYKTRVRSIMEYCWSYGFWQNASKTALHKLDNIQRKACKTMGKHCDVIPELNLSSLQHYQDIYLFYLFIYLKNTSDKC